MRSMYVVPVALALMLLAGCAGTHKTPRYVTNWSQLRTGMSKPEVKDLLGRPRYVSIHSTNSTRVPMARQFGDDKAALQADMEAIFGGPELWHYGKVGLVDPSDQAFLVYFSSDGHVIRWRRAMKGRHASASQPIEPEGLDDLPPPSQTPEELWKTPTLQPRK